jgi:hypothetical protein
MDPLTNIYERLRQSTSASSQHLPSEPPQLVDWLRYWNDEDTDLGNLRNFEHWLARSRSTSIGQR